MANNKYCFYHIWGHISASIVGLVFFLLISDVQPTSAQQCTTASGCPVYNLPDIHITPVETLQLKNSLEIQATVSIQNPKCLEDEFTPSQNLITEVRLEPSPTHLHVLPEDNRQYFQITTNLQTVTIKWVIHPLQVGHHQVMLRVIHFLGDCEISKEERVITVTVKDEYGRCPEDIALHNAIAEIIQFILTLVAILFGTGFIKAIIGRFNSNRKKRHNKKRHKEIREKKQYIQWLKRH